MRENESELKGSLKRAKEEPMKCDDKRDEKKIKKMAFFSFLCTLVLYDPWAVQ